MFYTIYKITNTINRKTYIGKHQTKDLNDGYFGSGKLLKRAIKKHGPENFTKEILFIFDNEQEMNAKEKELVVLGESSYNLCDGGQGGFGYINANLTAEERIKRSRNGGLNVWKDSSKIELHKQKQRIVFQRLHKEKKLPTPPNWSGKKHSEETKRKMSESRKKFLAQKLHKLND